MHSQLQTPRRMATYLGGSQNEIDNSNMARFYGGHDPSLRLGKPKSSYIPSRNALTPNGSISDQMSSGDQALSHTNLYIRGLTPSTSDDDLFALCQGYGKVISTKAIIDPVTNKCKGYGFVDFELAQDAEKAVKALQGQGIQAQMAKQQEQDPTNLYFANLPLQMTETDLEAMLSPYGQVTSTRVLRDMSGLSRCVGFARMESKDRCDTIIQVLNGKIIQGCRQPLLVKFADGGNKKKKAFSSGQPWIDRSQESSGIALYNTPANLAVQHAMSSQLAVAPSANGSFVRGYPMQGLQAYSLNSFQLQPGGGGGWYNLATGQYIVQPHMTAMLSAGMMPAPGIPTYDPSAIVPQLATQMGQLQLTGTTTADAILQPTSDLQNVDS